MTDEEYEEVISRMNEEALREECRTQRSRVVNMHSFVCNTIRKCLHATPSKQFHNAAHVGYYLRKCMKSVPMRKDI